jgi:Rieske Fe-S protein
MTGRRELLAGACAACAAVLAGCTTYDANGPGGFTGSKAPASAAGSSGSTGSAGGASSPGGSSSSPGGSSSGAQAPAALAATSQVPEGGGKIIDGKNIVITQPEAGTFKAFTAVCTHQGCIVSTVSGGTINCPCHGSKFSIKDGSVVNGPATSPLAAVGIKVAGTSIVQA